MRIVGDRVLDLEAFPTPGHASHHVSFLAPDGSCFTGDAAGVRIPPGPLRRPGRAAAGHRRRGVGADASTRSRRGGRRGSCSAHFGVADDPEPTSPSCARRSGPGRSAPAKARRRTSSRAAEADVGPRPTRRRRSSSSRRALLAVLRGPPPLLGQEGGGRRRVIGYAPPTGSRRSSSPCSSSALAAPAPASALRLVRVAGGFDSPVHVDGLEPGQRALRRRAGGADLEARERAAASLFLDIRNLVAYGGERGLFSIAFSAQLCASRGISTSTTRTTDGDVRVARFRANAVLQPGERGARGGCSSTSSTPRAGNHNGGQVAFGPKRPALRERRRRRRQLRPGRERPEPLEPQGKLLSINPGSARRGLAHRRLRPPQPLALLVRPRERTPLRRATWARSNWEEVDTSRASRLGGTPENFLWDRYEGRALSGCSTGGLRGPGDRISPDGRLQPLAGLLGHGRPRLPRAASFPGACAAGTSTATTAPAASGG